MGAALSRSLAKIFGSKEMRLLMLGLDAAGKTSMFPPPPARPPYRGFLHHGAWLLGSPLSYLEARI